MQNTFNFISTFAGIGGFDLGFELAGLNGLEQVERDSKCLSLLEKRFPKARRHNDIKEYSYHGRKTVNLICGGFPCQDVSIAGRRSGLAGERSGLYFEFERVIEESLPRFFVIENVSGLLSSNEGRDFETILEGMVKLGYRVAWRVFDSQFFGIPQRRKRVFIVGSLGDGSSASILFESESLSRGLKESGEEGEEDPSGARASSPGGLGRIAPTLMGSGSGTARPGGHDAELGFYVLSSGQANAEITEDISPTLTLLHEAPIIATINLANSGGGGNHVKDSRISDTLDSKNDLAIAYKISEGSGGSGYHDSKKTAFTLTKKDPQRIGIRRFTPLECERLQGFPDGWTEGFSDTVRYAMLGNAVSVPVAYWIGKRIKRLIELERAKETQ